MQNNGSKFLKPSRGPREQPVTNLKNKVSYESPIINEKKQHKMPKIVAENGHLF